MERGQVYLPSLVEGPELPRANALLQGSESAAQVVGPGLAGAIAAAVGAVGGMLLDAVSFLASAVCLLLVRASEPPPVRDPSGPRLRTEIAAGLRFVTRDPYLRPMTIAGAISNLGLVGYQSILIVFLVRKVGLSPGVVGALITVASLGGVLGATGASRLARRLGSARAYLLAEIAAAAAAPLVPLTGAGARLALFVAGSATLVAGVVAGNVIKGAWRQTYCPRRLLGRVITSSQLLNYGVIPAGALLAGTLASTLGVDAGIWIMTGVAAISPAILLPSALRGLRELPASSAPDHAVAPRAHTPGTSRAA